MTFSSTSLRNNYKDFSTRYGTTLESLPTSWFSCMIFLILLYLWCGIYRWKRWSFLDHRLIASNFYFDFFNILILNIVTNAQFMLFYIQPVRKNVKFGNNSSKTKNWNDTKSIIMVQWHRFFIEPSQAHFYNFFNEKKWKKKCFTRSFNREKGYKFDKDKYLKVNMERISQWDFTITASGCFITSSEFVD